MDSGKTSDGSSRTPFTDLDVRADRPLLTTSSAPDTGDAQVHDHNCPGGCGGQGYRYSNATAEESEDCTGRPYRFILRALNEDTGAVWTVLATDSAEAVAPWLDGDDPCTWVNDREVVPPPPVDLAKYDDCPF
jgi:hypothetical protein